MATYRAASTPADRAKAIAAVLAVHAGMAALLMLGGQATDPPVAGQPPTQLIDIALPPPPPPPEPAAASPEREAGAAGRKAEPAPIVVPPPKIALPTPNPIPAAPVAGSGSAPSAGAASAGTGPGAGGTGDGRGGGGTGGNGGIGADVRLLGGHRAKLPAYMLRQFAADRGTAQLRLTIATSGRVSACRVVASSGSAEVDQALCNVMLTHSRWQAARDLGGRAVPVDIRYTAIWRKD